MSRQTPVGVLLVRPPDLVRQGLERAIRRDPRFRLTAAVNDLRDAIDAARAAFPDSVLLAPPPAELRIVEACRSIKTYVPGSHLVVLRALPDRELDRALAQAGAAVVLMDLDPQTLLGSLLPGARTP